MANQQRDLATDNLIKRFFIGAEAFLGQLRQRETWQAFAHWILWRTLPKRRRIVKLARELNPLHENATAEMQTLREEVFSKSCLELKKPEEQKMLLDILNRAHQPLGYEQMLFSAVYPILIKRDMGMNAVPTDVNHRLDVEVGYLGHNEDYFFWVFEINGARRLSLTTALDVRDEQRADKRYVTYSLGSAGLVDKDYAEYAEQWLLEGPRLAPALRILATTYADQWILNSRIYLAHILADLKKRNYKITAEAIPDFERGRLSTLRRLALDQLRRHQSQSARRRR